MIISIYHEKNIKPFGIDKTDQCELYMPQQLQYLVLISSILTLTQLAPEQNTSKAASQHLEDMTEELIN